MRSRTLLLAFPILLATFATVASAREINENIHERFDVHEGMRLRLDHGDGSVTIMPWNKDVLDVTVTYSASVRKIGWGADPDFDVEFRQAGDSVHVIGRESGRSGIIVSTHRSVYAYEIRAPDYLRLDLDGEDGNVRIEKWRGEIDCTLDDGDVHLTAIASPRTSLELADGNLEIDGLEGELVVDSDDGNVHLSECVTTRTRIVLSDGNLDIRGCEGNLDIEVDDGDVELRRIRAGVLTIRSSDGDVSVDLLDTAGIDLDISTDDGDVDVDLEAGTSVTFSVATDDGRIEVDLPDTGQVEQGRGWAKGKTHDGEGRIRIRTEDGRVVLRETGR